MERSDTPEQDENGPGPERGHLLPAMCLKHFRMESVSTLVKQACEIMRLFVGMPFRSDLKRQNRPCLSRAWRLAKMKR